MMKRRHRSRRVVRGLIGVVLLSVVVGPPARAAGPVLHEYFEADPQEDLAFSATTRDGTMPAAIQTPNGPVSAPPERREPDEYQTAYGGTSTPNSTDATYRIDRNTTRPKVVGYDDPFTPAVAPFKRLFAYDAVDSGLELVVYDKRLREIEVGGQVQAGEDQFYADLFVDLAEDTPVRIPSVGPGARVLAARLEPTVEFELLRDGADNWFIRASERKRARLVMQLSISRAVFGSAFSTVSWSELARYAPPLPEVVHEQALAVVEALGLSHAASPRQAVATLVAHFRNFAASDDLPEATSGVALYKELALSQKGVCRHRAYAFVITALKLGIPARLVRNEAHAWVEVFDGSTWHRIDLGGAAERLEYTSDERVPPHRPPGDPYPWPEGAESGEQMAQQAFGGSSASGADTNARDSARAAASSAAPSASGRTPEPSPQGSAPSSRVSTEQDAPSAADDKPRAELALSVPNSEIRRGEPLEISGRAQADNEPCGYARIDIALRSPSGDRVPIGALPTDEAGRFSGHVTIPFSVDVGDYEVSVSTPGAGSCGASE